VRLVRFLWLPLFPALLLAAELSNPRPITPQSGLFTAPTWSPDGKLYCTDPQFTQIFQINLGNGAIRPIAKGNGIGFKFAFSPNGVIFCKKVVEGGRELWMIDSMLEVKRLAQAENLGSPVWYQGAIRVQFPDSTRSWDEAGNELSTSAVGWVFQDGEAIFRIRANLAPQRISPASFKACLPVTSPASDRVVYETVESGLMMVNLTSGASVALGPGSDAAWSSDGSFILFDVIENNGHAILSGDLFFIKSDGTGRQNLTESIPLVTTHPSLSPDGKRVAFTANGRIWLADFKK
jgi:Tol biopolymer transport system component